MLIMLICLAEFVLIFAIVYTYYNSKLKDYSFLKEKFSMLNDGYEKMKLELEKKNAGLLELSNARAGMEGYIHEKERYSGVLEAEKKTLEMRVLELNRDLIKMQERLASQNKLEEDLKILLEHAKLEITNQNRVQYQAVKDQLQKYTDEKSKEMTKEAKDAFGEILEKDVKETMVRLQENLALQQERLQGFQKPVDFFTKILAGSKDAGTHGEQTIENQLQSMGFRYGVDYLTQVSGKGGNEERLIADVVIFVPNSGKKDILIIDSKSSTKLGSEAKEFAASVESSSAIFARKDYKAAVERRLREEFPEMQINQTHMFIYLPFDRMLSRLAEENGDILRKIREKDVGVLTPVILDFLLDSIKLYSAKLDMKDNVENVMQDVRVLIERTAKVLELVRDLGKSVEQTGKRYSSLKSSVSRMFVPAVNRMAKPLNIKPVLFDDLNEEDLKQIEAKEA